MKFLLFLILLAAVGYFGYERVIRTSFDYPDQFRVSDQDGREVDIRLLARDETHFEFERLSDGRLFSYPIERLSFISRLRLRMYPERSLVALEPPVEPAAKGLSQMHREAMERELEKLRAEYDLQISKASAMPSCHERATLVHRLRETFYDIRKMEYDLEAFDLREGAALGTAR